MKKIVIGLSGGVDSSVAAYLLKEAGYDVYGVTMQTQKNGNDEMIADASKVAECLGIHYDVIDYSDVFKKVVEEYLVSEYLSGRTPNPCVKCNPHVKWASLLSYADKIGADKLATGHYADIIQLANGRYSIRMAASGIKDQSYVLAYLTQEQLKRTMMPLSKYEKSEIREIAKREGIPVAEKPDSQEICFIPDNDYAGYIHRESGTTDVAGNFVNTSGEIIGEHRGIIHYTVGQRKGLGTAFGKPMFVVEIKKETNEVVLGEGHEVFSPAFFAGDINYMGAESFRDGEEVIAKIRYAHKGTPCKVYNRDGGLWCEFDSPQRAITPGQTAVFYDNDGCILAGGDIRKY